MNFHLFKMIFWDFDGVIKESFSIKTDAFENIFKPYGDNISNKVKKHHIENGGMSRFEKIPLYLKWSGVEPTSKKVKEICSLFSKTVKNKVINSAWVPGVETFIKKNKQKFIFIIVSATPQNEIEEICKSLKVDNCFSKIYGSPTSKSIAIKQSILDYGIEPEKCLMIGDAMSDFQAAKQNNINFLFRRHKHNQNLKISFDYSEIYDFKNK